MKKKNIYFEKYNNKRYDYKVVRLRLDAFKNLSEYEQALLIAADRIIKEIGENYERNFPKGRAGHKNN